MKLPLRHTATMKELSDRSRYFERKCIVGRTNLCGEDIVLTHCNSVFSPLQKPAKAVSPSFAENSCLSATSASETGAAIMLSFRHYWIDLKLRQPWAAAAKVLWHHNSEQEAISTETKKKRADSEERRSVLLSMSTHSVTWKAKAASKKRAHLEKVRTFDSRNPVLGTSMWRF